MQQFLGCLIIAILLFLTTNAQYNELQNKKVTVNANTASKIPTATPTNLHTDASLNSTVGEISYDSSRVFIKWISPSRKVATTTYAKSVLSTQIFIESDDSAISINRGKRKPTAAPTAIFTTSPTKAPAKSPRISPTLLPTKKAPTLNALPTVSPTKVVQSPTVAPTISNKSPPIFSMAPTNNRIALQSAAPTLHISSSPTAKLSKATTSKPSNIKSSPIRKSSPLPYIVPSVEPSVTPMRPPSFNKNFQYYPGKKIMNGTVNLYNIYFGLFSRYNFLNSSQQTLNLVDYFSSNIGSSSWYKTLTTYYQINSDGSKTYVSASVERKRSAVYQSTVKERTIADDTVIPTMIVSLFNLPQQPLPVDVNGIYNVFFRGDFIYNNWLKDPDSGGWCGFHSNFALKDGRVLKYTVIGDPSSGPSDSQAYCEGIAGAPTVNGNIGADSMVNILAHEIAEVVTNDDKAWNDESLDGDGENGDICGWDFQLGENPNNTNWNIVVGQKKFLVQSIYRVDYGCVLSSCC